VIGEGGEVFPNELFKGKKRNGPLSRSKKNERNLKGETNQGGIVQWKDRLGTSMYKKGKGSIQKKKKKKRKKKKKKRTYTQAHKERGKHLPTERGGRTRLKISMFLGDSS